MHFCHACLQVLNISLVIGDSASIRAALHDVQLNKYGKIKAISAHCPTRWGILVFIIEDVIDSEDALRALVESAAWKEVSKGSQNAGACRVLHGKGIVIAELQKRAATVVHFFQTHARICAHMHTDIPMVACMCRLSGRLQEG